MYFSGEIKKDNEKQRVMTFRLDTQKHNMTRKVLSNARAAITLKDISIFLR
jgi:hypothetical protein